MNTKLLFTFLTALVFLCMKPVMADYPFTEDFESEDFPPEGWAIYNEAGDETWEQTGLVNHTPGGEYAAMHMFAFGDQDGWLVTPQISVPEEGSSLLTFWNFNGDADWYEKNSVLLSTGSPDPADNDYVEVWSVSQVQQEWVQVFIDLPTYAGQDIYIAFRYEGNNAHIWAIDDIAMGEESASSPIMTVTPLEIEQNVSQTGTSTSSINIQNDGIGALTYDIDFEYMDEEGWLEIDPLNGSVEGSNIQVIDLTFHAIDLDIGAYSASITITSNDSLNPEVIIPVTMNVIDASPVNIVILQDSHTFPVAISENGQHVVGIPFGGGSGYYWSEETGVINIAESVDGVSNTGEVVVTYNDPDLLYNGNSVLVTGLWSSDTDEIEFIGMNPEQSEFFMDDYNSGQGISSDGTVVGMQYFQPYQFKAFSWTEGVGYDNIGDHPSLPEGNRPNGITANGEIVYGWAQLPGVSRTPVIWHDGDVIFIDNTASGEAWGGSPNAQYIIGNVGTNGFIWNSDENETLLFQNTLNNDGIFPVTVSNEGYVFGFTAGSPPFPPDRRAFVREPGGNITTFNDYAIGRGWFDATDWTFYAITGVSGDGNRFIGAGIDKDGNNVSFMIDFAPAQPVIDVNPMSLSENLEVDQTSEQTFEISNTGDGELTYNAVIQFLIEDAKIQEVPAGRSSLANRGNLQLAKKENTDGFHPATKANDKNDIILNYDGANVDAIGLIAGGTFYGAARYPSEMVAPFGGYMLESVDVYIGDIPTEISLMIWDAGTTTTPGALLHEQVFTPDASSWNTVVLDEALEVSGADLWVGLEITNDADVFVLGIDGGPANTNGNWLSEDAVEWEHISDYGLNGNWNIRARLQYGGVQWLTIDPASGTIVEDQIQTVTVDFDATGLESGTYTANIRINSNATNEELVIVPVSLDVDPLSTYNLSLIAQPENGGTLTGEGEYIEDEAATVIATAAEGFTFVNWTDAENEVVSSEPEFDFTMPAEDVTLFANFEEIPPVIYTLNLLVNPEDAGTVSGAGDYEEGTVAMVNAIANEGYEFTNWTDADDNIISEVAENEITITGDLTLIANFLLISNVDDVWENQLTIYPNPASELINFMSDEIIRNLELYNLTGQKLYSAEVNVNNYKLDVSALPQGFYLVKLTSVNGDILTTRILIAR